MAWAFVQANNIDFQNQQFSQAIRFSGNTVVGNRAILVINFWRNGPSSNVTVSDPLNGDWTLDAEQEYADGGFTGKIAIFSVHLAQALLSTTDITVVSPDSIDDGRVAVLEYSGLDDSATPVDVSALAAGSSNSPASGSANTTEANELALAVFGDDGYNRSWSAAPAGYTERMSAMQSGSHDTWIGDKDSGAAGAISASGTLSGSAAWGMGVVVYRLLAEPEPEPEEARMVRCGYDARGLSPSDRGCGALTNVDDYRCCGFSWCSESCLGSHWFSTEHSATTAGPSNGRGQINEGTRISRKRI